ncbi:PAS domain-containing protein [Janthinobacterium fluminis]|uniref:histidine kinase n=1 Tax=Janthinobacterium fluminis TaxID=2987524 RepID=A0ABT5K4J9_9BURK|nr:PAS domain-containing protein [Janthinobacterium fluminis]MDC8759902.1 PAS domain-containing protein [Janthinobacterium fluminis]
MRALPPPWLGELARSHLGRRFAILILLFSSLVTLLSTAFQLALEYRRDVRDIAAQLGQVEASYAASLASSLWITSNNDLQLQLQGVMRLPDLQYAEVRSEVGQLVAKAGQPGAGAILSREFPLRFTHRGQAVYIGKVRLVASLDGVYRRLREKVIVILVTQTAKTFLVSLFILVLFQYLLGRHLKRIAAYSDRLFAGPAEDALALRRRGGAGDELDHMVAALNGMRARLDQTLRGLQESEFRWKFALEGAGDGVWDFDIPSGAVIYSPRWKEMLGYRDEELANHLDTYTTLCHPDDLRRAQVLLDANFAGLTDTYSIEQRMRCKDGSWKWVMARGMVVAKDAGGRALRMIGTHTDVSARRNAEDAVQTMLAQTEQARAALRAANAGMEAQVRERTAQLELANKELEAFSYSVSHDLRSPLRGIDGWSLALQEDYGERLDATGRQYLDRVRGESQRMGRLIDDMLHFSRLGRAAMTLREVDLTAMARQIAARIAEREPERAFVFDIEEGLAASGDCRLLEVALENLLQNAAKFSAGRAPARIAVGRAGAADAGAQPAARAFFVRDNGAGFDMLYAQKLFGVFQRLHKASEFPGSGIGLATVQRIVQRHGGAVWGEAAIGSGATFYFTLKDQP